MSSLPQTKNKKAVTTPKTDAFQYVGKKIPNKGTTSVLLISIDILTAQKKLRTMYLYTVVNIALLKHHSR